MKTTYIDTYQNLKKATPVFYKRNGELTAYGLHCGYVETHTTKGGFEIQLYCEHEHYHVKTIDLKKENFRRIEWDCFDTVNPAWKQYRKLKAKYKTR